MLQDNAFDRFIFSVEGQDRKRRYQIGKNKLAAQESIYAKLHEMFRVLRSE
jgi:hypothetical protein